eukprot:scpid88325/ scgid13479/ 
MYDNAAWSCWPAGIFNVRKVINSVLALVGKRAHCLPSHGTLSQLYVELKGPVSLQLAEELEGEENTTLHSAVTSKHGCKYGSSFQITTNHRGYSLGLVNIERGWATHTLEMLKSVLPDVATVISDSEGIAERIMSNGQLGVSSIDPLYSSHSRHNRATAILFESRSIAPSELYSTPDANFCQISTHTQRRSIAQTGKDSRCSSEHFGAHCTWATSQSGWVFRACSSLEQCVERNLKYFRTSHFVRCTATIETR